MAKSNERIKLKRLLIFCCLLTAQSAFGSSFDNENGRYVLKPFPSADAEAERMDRMRLSDQQPAGRYLRSGEVLTIRVRGLDKAQSLEAAIGFRPMFEIAQDQQEVDLDNGVTTFAVEQDGPLFFRLISLDGATLMGNSVAVEVTGGRPLPLYVEGSSDLSSWRAELVAHQDAPFVQLVSRRAIITLPTGVHDHDPIDDPVATFAMIDRVLRYQNELAGFDERTSHDRSTPLRHHFLVDFRASKKNRKKFSMYATDEFIGMQSDNTGGLTNPLKLAKEWAIWHEVGHTHQQNSWTWESLTEVSVNLFSLYIQEKMGEPSRLSLPGEDGLSARDKAGEYVARRIKNYRIEGDDYDELFVKLVMFEQLKDTYGWQLVTSLFKHYRRTPLPVDASDDEKVDAFVVLLCKLAGDDLRPFLEDWGLHVSKAANQQIDAMNLIPRNLLQASGR